MAKWGMGRGGIFSGSGGMKGRRWVKPFERGGIHMRRTGIGRKLALAAQIAALMLGGSHAALALDKVRILIPVRAIDEAFSPFAVAKEKGYFEAEGYDVSLLAVGGSNQAALPVSAGNAEAGAASPGEPILGIPSGPLQIRLYLSMS